MKKKTQTCSDKDSNHEQSTCPDYRFCWRLKKPFPDWAQSIALKTGIPVKAIIPVCNLYNRDFSDFTVSQNSYQKLMNIVKDKTINLSPRPKLKLVQ